MRFVSLITSVVAKARRSVTQGLSVGHAGGGGEATKPDPVKLAEQLRQVMLRVNKLEAIAGKEGTEFEATCLAGGAMVELRHGFNGPVRWYVTKWLRTVGGTVNGASLVESNTSTPNTLFIRSFIQGRAVIRVEPSNYMVEPGP